MVKCFFVVIPFPPVPLARPRFSRKGTWDPQKEIKEWVTVLLLQEVGKIKRLEGPLSMELMFHLEISKCCSKRRRRDLLSGMIFQKPDLSNLIKFIEDVMEGILFFNDSQIVSLKAEKAYSETPKTVIKIWELTPPLEE